MKRLFIVTIQVREVKGLIQGTDISIGNGAGKERANVRNIWKIKSTELDN